jgi:hypothetical protein
MSDAVTHRDELSSKLEGFYDRFDHMNSKIWKAIETYIDPQSYWENERPKIGDVKDELNGISTDLHRIIAEIVEIQEFIERNL